MVRGTIFFVTPCRVGVWAYKCDETIKFDSCYKPQGQTNAKVEIFETAKNSQSIPLHSPNCDFVFVSTIEPSSMSDIGNICPKDQK